jgi:hypothetical protein
MHGRPSARNGDSIHGRPDRSSSVTLFGPFLNVSVHSYRFRCSKALSPFRLLYLVPTLTPSANKKNRIIARFSFVHVVSATIVLAPRVLKDN